VISIGRRGVGLWHALAVLDSSACMPMANHSLVTTADAPVVRSNRVLIAFAGHSQEAAGWCVAGCRNRVLISAGLAPSAEGGAQN